MNAASLRDILSELLAEAQDLRANQKLLTYALEKAGVNMSLAEAGDIKLKFVKEAEREMNVPVIREQIQRLEDK